MIIELELFYCFNLSAMILCRISNTFILFYFPKKFATGLIKTIMILKLIIVVAMTSILISDTAESSGKGNRKTDHVVERIQKSQHKIVHSIEVKSQVRKHSIMSRNSSEQNKNPQWRFP